jgi:hypothetical protein
MSDCKTERLERCYRIANVFIKSEHKREVDYSWRCCAILSISASILACKLFDLDVGHPGGDEPFSL